MGLLYGVEMQSKESIFFVDITLITYTQNKYIKWYSNCTIILYVQIVAHANVNIQFIDAAIEDSKYELR